MQIMQNISELQNKKRGGGSRWKHLQKTDNIPMLLIKEFKCTSCLNFQINSKNYY